MRCAPARPVSSEAMQAHPPTCSHDASRMKVHDFGHQRRLFVETCACSTCVQAYEALRVSTWLLRMRVLVVRTRTAFNPQADPTAQLLPRRLFMGLRELASRAAERTEGIEVACGQHVEDAPSLVRRWWTMWMLHHRSMQECTHWGQDAHIPGRGDTWRKEMLSRPGNV